jgi:predicted dehydrogenase
MITRRHFLGTTSAAGFALKTAAAQEKKTSANDRIQIALIGCGGQGQGDAEASTSVPGVKLIAAADIYDGRLLHMKELYGKDIFTTRDYRQVLARKDIDAVIIGTPDHWHSKITVDALNAGKDVYCEKPMVQLLPDGPPVIEAQRRTGRIVQIGSQRVSSIVYQKAQELFRSGAIGELNMVEAWWDRNSANGAWQYFIPPDASPANIDWDAFLGRAPKRPFEPIRLFRWRNYRDYGTGVGGDLFVHLFSGIHFVLGSRGPNRVFATGGLRYWKDGRDVPDVFLGEYDYPKTDAHPEFTLALRVNFKSGAGETSGFRFVGSEGIMTIGGGVSITRTPNETEPGYGIDTFAKATQEEFLKRYRQEYPPKQPTIALMPDAREEHYQAPRGYSDHYDHHRNFIEAVRTRKPVVDDAAFGYRAAAPAVASNTSYFESRIVNWDPDSMREV